MSSPLFIGIDAGGTKTAALARTDGAPTRFSRPGAQLMRDGTESTAEALADIIQEARAAHEGAALGRVVVGLAGAGRAEQRDAMAHALQSRIGEVPVGVTHDAEIALEAAFGEAGGTVVLVGTGSCVFARAEDGETYRAGGWGAALGDDGSGTALGRATLRAALAVYDGGPPTALAEGVAEALGLADGDAIRAAVYLDGLPLASLTPVLFAAIEADDWVASSILTRETNALGQQVGWIATRAGDALPHQLAYAGGLANEAVYRASLAAALERHVPGWAIQASEKEAVEGALAMAERLSA